MIKVTDRTILWSGEVTEDLALELATAFVTLEESADPIKIMCLGSVGGEWDHAGLGLLDLISNSSNHVSYYALGASSSSAALLFCCGDERVIGPNSYLMFHDGSMTVDASMEAHSKLVEVTKVLCRDTHVFLSNIAEMNKPPKYFEEKLKKDWYVFADEAVSIGLATDVYHYPYYT